MRDALARHIASRHALFGKINPDTLSFTKFCQRIVQPHTKVLFLVTHAGAPLCVIKTMRDASFNSQLHKEAQAQSLITSHGSIAVPQIYFEETIGGRYVYAEEVIEGLPVSLRTLRAYEQAFVAFAAHFQKYRTRTAVEIAECIAPHLPPDRHLAAHLQVIRESGAVLHTGLTHGDLGRPNILKGEKLYVIDWERAGECPFAFIDAVQVITQARRIETLEEWRRFGAPRLCAYTGVTRAQADALWSLKVLFERLYKKYPANYRAAAEACKTLL